MADATIRDVARRAQVSVASVSRALNGLDNVSESTKARVANAARELGYVPHAGARSLSLARTNAIGVVLPDLHGEFFSEIVRGMDREAADLNPADQDVIVPRREVVGLDREPAELTDELVLHLAPGVRIAAARR